MFCKNCGKELRQEWRICPGCGKAVSKTTYGGGRPTNTNGPSNAGTNGNSGYYNGRSGYSRNNSGGPGVQPRYSNNASAYSGNQAGGAYNGSGKRSGGSAPSPMVIMWGAVAGLAVLGAVIFGGLMISSGKENPADTIGDYYVTGCKDVVKVRETPDEEGSVLTKLSNGEKVSLVDRGDDEYWKVYIKAEKVTGYMPNYYLTNERGAVTDPVTRYVKIKDGETLTIRSLPKESAAAVGMLERGQKVTLMADMSGDFDYIYAVNSKTYGYVKGSKLSEEKVKAADASAQTVITSQPTQQPTQPSQPQQPQQPTQTQDRVFGRGAAPSSHLGQYYVCVQKGYLALRNAKAFDSANEIGQMNNGDYVWAIDTSGTYWYVYSPSLGMYGYTNSEYLTTSPTAPSRSQSPSAPTYLGVYHANVATGYLALRNDTAYDASNEIGQIQNGEEVDVIDMSAGQYWYVYVPSLNREGYVNSQYLR